MRIALRQCEERVELRHEANIPATLFHDGVGVPATIKNISSYGAMLSVQYAPPLGSQVSIITDGRELLATIIWARDDKCGVLLNYSVDPADWLVSDR